MIQEYKDNRFDTDEFAKMSYRRRINYLRETIGNPIGNGSSRIVWEIERGKKVLKLAKNQKGLAQNLNEIQCAGWYDYGYMFPEVYEADKDNGTYIISEMAERAKSSDFPKYLGVTYQYFKNFCIGAANEYERTPYGYRLTSKDYEVAETNDTISDFYSYISNCQPFSVGEIISLRNLGFVLRESKRTLVIIDSGLDEQTYDRYYKPKGIVSPSKMYNLVSETKLKTLSHKANPKFRDSISKN